MDAQKIKSLTEKVGESKKKIAGVHAFFCVEGGAWDYSIAGMEENPINFYQQYIDVAKTAYLNLLKEISSSKELIILFKEEVGGMKKSLAEIETYAGRLLVNATRIESARKRDVEIDRLEDKVDKVLIPLIVKEVYGGKRVQAKKYVSKSELEAQINGVKST